MNLPFYNLLNRVLNLLRATTTSLVCSTTLIVRAPSGVAGTDEIHVYSTGGVGVLEFKPTAYTSYFVSGRPTSGTNVIYEFRGGGLGGGNRLDICNDHLRIASGQQFSISSTTDSAGAADTGLKRAAAGQVQATDGSTGLGGMIVRGDATMPFVVRQSGGVAGTDEGQILHNGAALNIDSKDGPVILLGTTLFTYGTALARGSNGQHVWRSYWTGQQEVISTGSYTWNSSSTDIAGGSADTGLKRAAAGQVQATDGSTGLGGMIVRGDATMPFVVRQSGGVAGTDEVQISHDGSNATIRSMDGNLRLVPGSSTTVKVLTSDAGNNIAAIGVHNTRRTLQMGSTSYIGFCSSADADGGDNDANFSRATAGVIGVYGASTSTAGWLQNTAGDLVLASNFTNSSGTMTNTNFSWPVISGRSYDVEANLIVDTATGTDGFKCDFDGGVATASLVNCKSEAYGGTTVASNTTMSTLAQDIVYTTTSGALIRITGVIVASSTGTCIFRAASNAVAGTTMTLSAGSRIKFSDMRAV